MHIRLITNLVEELVGVAALCGEQDAVVGEDPQAGAGVADGLHGVLNLHIVTIVIKIEDIVDELVTSTGMKKINSILELYEPKESNIRPKFDLIEAPLGAEDGGAGVVAAGHLD